MAGYGMCTLTKKIKQLASAIFQVYSHTRFPAGSSAAQPRSLRSSCRSHRWKQQECLSAARVPLNSGTMLSFFSCSEKIFSKNHTSNSHHTVTFSLNCKTDSLEYHRSNSVLLGTQVIHYNKYLKSGP